MYAPLSTVFWQETVQVHGSGSPIVPFFLAAFFCFFVLRVENFFLFVFFGGRALGIFFETSTVDGKRKKNTGPGHKRVEKKQTKQNQQTKQNEQKEKTNRQKEKNKKRSAVQKKKKKKKKKNRKNKKEKRKKKKEKEKTKKRNGV